VSGYTQTELDDAQEKWNLRFPPDLVAILLERRRVVETEFEKSFWIDQPDDVVREILGWPFESFWFDIENGSWWPEWGDRPAAEQERKEKFQAIFAHAPKLVPVYGHRYLPSEPHESGNPVFSVWQMDVIMYGANLDDYIHRESNPQSKGWPQPGDTNVKRIRFWTRAVELNNERFVSGQGFAFLNRGGILPES
jgi:hypothetical protein